MGHKTIAMTIRYSHLAPSHQREAIERLVSPQSREVIEVQTGTRTGTSGFQGSSETQRSIAQVH